MTTHQPFIHNDSDGNSLTLHGGAQDDGNDAVAIEVEQLGRGSAWVHVRHANAARVADELRAAAGLPPTNQASIERAFAERLAAELKGCCTECDACIEIAQHLAGDGEAASENEGSLTERLERGRAQLLEAMSAVSEDRTCTGWAADWARTLHAEGGIWETLGRAVGWPTGNYDQWVWVSWGEAAALYASKESR